jgi:hypothetical protein
VWKYSRALTVQELRGLYLGLAPGTVYSAADLALDPTNANNAIVTYRPRYLGKYAYASKPTTANLDDTCVLYSATLAERGIFKWTAAGWGSKLAAPTSEQIAAAWADICWAINNGYITSATAPDASEYTGSGINFFNVLGACVAFINELYVKHLEAAEIETGTFLENATKNIRLTGDADDNTFGHGLVLGSYDINGNPSDDDVKASLGVYSTASGKGLSEILKRYEADIAAFSDDDKIIKDTYISDTLTTINFYAYHAGYWAAITLTATSTAEWLQLSMYKDATHQAIFNIRGSSSAGSNYVEYEAYEGANAGGVRLIPTSLYPSRGTPTLGKSDALWSSVYASRHVPAASLDGDTTQNIVFDTFSPFVPTTNDEALMCGGIGAFIVSRIKRQSSTVVRIYYSTSGSNSYLDCTNGSATAVNDVSLAM